ncbi:response regulator [Halopseudomonas formosensis]|uniref:Response regulator n=1 Tax=Halopseudomonas formosensis TaxID=1002526 RepID=A0ABU5BY52_9GAMM|nr:response regulator [Halopseudomonas formosensis]MDX9687717.1 response regulator [Halopseudomonas formosensis]
MIEYNRKQFLVVDDFTDFRAALIGMLRQMGVNDIDAVGRGEEALALCRRNQYDVILHDYNLGSGKNGQQVLEELHHRRLLPPHCVFVMISAESSQAMVLAALECEPDSYLAKPFNQASLQQRLDRLIAMKTALRPLLEAHHEGEHARVLEACRQVIAAHPRYRPQCQRYLVMALGGLGQHGEQERVLRDLIAERPVPWAMLALAELYRNSGRLDEARDTYEEGIRQFPRVPAMYDGLAATALAQGDPEQAQDYLQQGLRLSPNSLRRQETMGSLARRNRDHEQAARAYRQAVELGRHSLFRNPENHLNLVSSLHAQSDDGTLSQRQLVEIRQTLTELDRTWRDDPALAVRSRLAQAQTLRRTGQEDEARRLTDQALEQLQEMPGFFSAEAAMQVFTQLEELGQSQRAQQVLATCAEMYGDDSQVMDALARHTDDPDILAAGSEALEWNRQGILQYQQKQYAAALELFRRAGAAQPRNISFALNTAQSLLRLISREPSADLVRECRACLQRASQMPADDHRRERYLKLCDRLEAQ